MIPLRFTLKDNSPLTIRPTKKCNYMGWGVFLRPVKAPYYENMISWSPDYLEVVRERKRLDKYDRVIVKVVVGTGIFLALVILCHWLR